MDINDLKKIGLIIKIGDKPLQVLNFSHGRTAQRKATVKTKLRNLITGQVLEKTFNSGDEIREADIKKEKTSFLYKSGNEFYFLNPKNFEQFTVPQNLLGEKTNFLKDELEIVVLYFEDQPISVELPKKVDLKVVSAPPALKGNSVNKPSKIATLETGLSLSVPIFVEENDIVRVNTETGEYVERILN